MTVGGDGVFEKRRITPVWKISFLKLNLPAQFSFSPSMLDVISLFPAHVRSWGWEMKPLAWGLVKVLSLNFSSLSSVFFLFPVNMAHLMDWSRLSSL